MSFSQTKTKQLTELQKQMVATLRQLDKVSITF
jgi:hypothetical protein